LINKKRLADDPRSLTGGRKREKLDEKVGKQLKIIEKGKIESLSLLADIKKDVGNRLEDWIKKMEVKKSANKLFGKDQGKEDLKLEENLEKEEKPKAVNFFTSGEKAQALRDTSTMGYMDEKNISKLIQTIPLSKICDSAPMLTKMTSR
jgi:hypothetical protein